MTVVPLTWAVTQAHSIVAEVTVSPDVVNVAVGKLPEDNSVCMLLAELMLSQFESWAPVRVIVPTTICGFVMVTPVLLFCAASCSSCSISSAESNTVPLPSSIAPRGPLRLPHSGRILMLL